MSTFPQITEDVIAPSLGGDLDGNRTFRRTLKVLAPTSFDALAAVFSARGIGVGQVYKDAAGNIPDPRLKVIDFNIAAVSPAINGDDGMWSVSFTYDTRAGGSNGGTQRPTPGGYPVFYWDTGVATVEKFTDHAGNPILNSKGLPPRNGIPTVIATLTLEVQRYVGSYDVSQMVGYASACNSDNWRGLAPGQAMCLGRKPTPQSDGLYLEATRFEMRADGFDSAVPDVDEDGNLLDGKGSRIGASDRIGSAEGRAAVPQGVVKTIQAGKGTLLVWRTQPRLPFAGLGF
ncbi:MAG: hypothetical protein K8S99_06885 [Planctomycetes bacterium]|nr:hypothetical protein [Planctomycetota bacterium]